jgi:hypothetical protein
VYKISIYSHHSATRDSNENIAVVTRVKPLHFSVLHLLQTKSSHNYNIAKPLKRYCDFEPFRPSRSHSWIKFTTEWSLTNIVRAVTTRTWYMDTIIISFINTLRPDNLHTLRPPHNLFVCQRSFRNHLVGFKKNGRDVHEWLGFMNELPDAILAINLEEGACLPDYLAYWHLTYGTA